MSGRSHSMVVVVDRVEPGQEPPYCVHGKSPCVGCEDWCWLGDQSLELVQSGQAAPLCRECAAKYIPAGQRPVGHVDDH